MKRHFITLIILFSCLMAKAQTPTQERRIYLVDVTASMEGRGSIETPDIFADVKKSLISTISHIDDSRTEVIVIPFTNKPLNRYAGTIAKKDSLINDINGLSIRKGDTNIADAWQEGLTYIDSTRINYLFLLTDGLHNCGPTKDELYTRLSAWGEQSQGKYMFAFYVMLTENAKELEICKIVDATRNLWLIESMDIDASLIKTKTLMKTNVFDNHQASISFESNNPSLDLNSIGLNIALEDNSYYEIGDIEQSVMMHNTFRFSVIEKMAKKDIPIIDTIGLRIKHDSEKYPFVFFTPDYVDFIIANQGTRTVSISDRKLEGKELSSLNLKKLKYKEPFRGPFKWARKYLESTLSYPPFKWCKPDTAIVEFPLYISFNEESVRSCSSIGFLMCDNEGNKLDYMLSNTDSLITASEEGYTAMYRMTILPGSREKMISGRIYASTSNVDKINGVDAAYGFDYFADWEAKYKQPWPIVLWLLWILPIVILIVVILLVAEALYMRWESYRLKKSIISAANNACSLLQKQKNRPQKKSQANSHNSENNWRKRVHRKTGWSYAIINCIKTPEEAEIYIKANLKEAIVGNRPALIRQDIDWSAYNCRKEWLQNELADWGKWQDYNNADLIGEGYPPRDSNGDPYELHHIGQRQDSPFAELTWNEHMGDGNNTILHQMGKESEINRGEFDTEKAQYWRDRYSMFSQTELDRIYK